MMVSTVLYLMFVSLITTRVLAGTYGPNYNHPINKTTTVGHLVEELANEQNPWARPQHIPQQQIYTRTIVRPVSFSYISANILSNDARNEEEITETQQNSQHHFVKPKLLTRNGFLGSQPVLPGNLLVLHSQDVEQLKSPLRSNPELEELVPPTESRTSPSELETQVEALPSQYTSSVRPSQLPTIEKTRKPVIQYSRRPNSVHQQYKNKAIILTPPLAPARAIPKPVPETVMRKHPHRSLDQKADNDEQNLHLHENKQLEETDEKSDEEQAEDYEEERDTPVPWKQTHADEDEFDETDDSDEELLAGEKARKKSKEFVDYYPGQYQSPSSKSLRAVQNDQKHSASAHEADKKKESSGGGSEYEESHISKKGEKGEKGYKENSTHKHGKKGHHDKEGHKGEYEDEKGIEKKHHNGEQYFGAHHKEEKGQKGKKYGEGKKHKKGHTTHGEHNIVKKDEYIKSTKFYDEDHDGGEEEKHGEFQGKHAEKEGGNKKGGHLKKAYEKEKRGKKGHHDKGHSEEEEQGYSHKQGHKDFYGREEEAGSSKGIKNSKKWKKN